MPSYQMFTTTRTTAPDPVTLLANVRSAVNDATAGVSQLDATHVVVKKVTPFSAGDLAAAQSAIDTCPALTPQRAAQNEIDNWPVVWKALALTLLDQINILRANDGLGAITPAQAIAAIRTKAGQL